MKRKYPVIDMVKTGHNIKRIMAAKGLKVKDIQSFLELSAPQAVYHWLSGKSMPTIDNLYALSELFCTPMDMLLIGNRKYMPSEDVMCQRLCMYFCRFMMLTEDRDKTR